ASMCSTQMSFTIACGSGTSPRSWIRQASHGLKPNLRWARRYQPDTCRMARGPRCWSRSVEPFPELCGTPTSATSHRLGSSTHGHRKKVGMPHQYQRLDSRFASSNHASLFDTIVVPPRVFAHVPRRCGFGRARRRALWASGDTGATADDSQYDDGARGPTGQPRRRLAIDLRRDEGRALGRWCVAPSPGYHADGRPDPGRRDAPPRRTIRVSPRRTSMAAYVIADIEITDAAGYEEYRRRVPETVAQYGGRYMARGGVVETLEGNWQ